MVCPSCGGESAHIKIVGDNITCSICGGFSETGGSPTDKILSRNATRITEQQVQYEADMITPYVVDKSTNQVVVNEDFIALYPEQAAQTFSREELKQVGQEWLESTPDTDDGQGIEFTGDEKQAIDAIVKE